ncbi:nuclease-related domain-containing protein [Neobacillus soli]|uniref:nuclease-related domain-containing protein n=1 Tax=Neobacillus soli TaxID=220688 RepID=UPI0008245C19|nr:nuclease-related domain-containing protein [Neobacillus soli]
MSFKPRFEPSEVTLLRLLNARMELAEKDKQRYQRLVKGFEGEVMFDALTEKLQCRSNILNELLLESNGSKFQIDSLIMTQEPLCLFEVKNYEGDFYFKNDRFYMLAKKEKEIKNPLLQLERCESLLRQLLQNLGVSIPIEAYVVFINPQFQLYQAPLNKPIIYPNQLPRFMEKFDKRPSQLNGFHKKLADQLVSMHQTELPYGKLPGYDFARLKKGMTCAPCGSLQTIVADRNLVCEVCGHMEEIDHAILRSVVELKLLFPDMKITTGVVYEWCGVVGSIKTIRRVLMQNYSAIGKKEYSFINLK